MHKDGVLDTNFEKWKNGLHPYQKRRPGLITQDYRGLFPLDGAGLRCLFHNGAIITTNQNRRFDDVINFTNYSATTNKNGGHYEIGPALTLIKSVHFGSIVKK